MGRTVECLLAHHDPDVRATIAVVATTMVITALKAFDIVYVMTNGAYDTDVVALRMYKECSAIATALQRLP
jgi:ABC-type sugar transport system permease subunit